MANANDSQPSGNQTNSNQKAKPPVWHSNMVTATNFSASGKPDLQDVNPNGGRTEYECYDNGDDDDSPYPQLTIPQAQAKDSTKKR